MKIVILAMSFSQVFANLRSVTTQKSNDIILTFEEYLDEKLQADVSNNVISDKLERLTRLRNEQLRYYRNATALPETLLDWYEQEQAGAGLRSMCPPGADGPMCNTFMPFEKVWNYGCWCYFSEDAGSGSGNAVDALDQVCKELQFCYRCAKIDSYDGTGDICSPGETDYVVEIFKAMHGGIYLACSEHNIDDHCAVHTCCCETQFVSQILQLFFSGFTFIDQYDREDGFDVSVCSIGTPGPPSVFECCGTYPHRFPYAIGNAVTACCDDSILYQIQYKDCCADGSVAPRGTCSA